MNWFEGFDLFGGKWMVSNGNFIEVFWCSTLYREALFSIEKRGINVLQGSDK